MVTRLLRRVSIHALLHRLLTLATWATATHQSPPPPPPLPPPPPTMCAHGHVHALMHASIRPPMRTRAHTHRAQRLVVRGLRQVNEVLDKYAPATDRECDWRWTSLRCEPRDQCRFYFKVREREREREVWCMIGCIGRCMHPELTDWLTYVWCIRPPRFMGLACPSCFHACGVGCWMCH